MSKVKTGQFKVRILFIGPCNVGKSKIANFLADMSLELPEDVRATDSLRILEYDLSDIDVNNQKANIDVQLWDTSGKESTSAYWPILRKYADGIVFVSSGADENGVKGMDYMYNYFITQQNFSLRACLVCSLTNPESNTTKLPSMFTKISQINVNLEANSQKFRQEFTKFVISVINTMEY
ncbi:intraflagellar transport protein 22 homolog [Atheta coriaria]|uniref:intraflagellar transport protein 22 homolog n=1 Tax=Dalotia coriaria TaxID=877792 RepID=UPI0031F4617E